MPKFLSKKNVVRPQVWSGRPDIDVFKAQRRSDIFRLNVIIVCDIALPPLPENPGRYSVHLGSPERNARVNPHRAIRPAYLPAHHFPKIRVVFKFL